MGMRRVMARSRFGRHSMHNWLSIVATRVQKTAGSVLSVIIPVFNERKTCRTLIDRVLEKQIDGVELEIIIVESNSTDGSREDVLRYADHPRVRIVLQERPNGKGNAVRAGLAEATGDIVLFQDADLEYDIDDYDQLIAPIRAYRQNFVIGSRHNGRGSSWKIRDFNQAPVLSQVFNFGHLLFLSLLNGMYGQKMIDPFSMFKVFRRDCLAGLEFECNRFDFDFEIVIKLIRKGYRPIEIPVNYRSRSIAEGKKVTMVRDPLTWLRALVRYRKSSLYPSIGQDGTRSVS
jgi:glycosyltransferase involved in cell wall biosynthesis